MEIYSIQLDEVSFQEGCWLGTLNGCQFECFTQCEDESASEMISADYVRVEKSPDTDGHSTLWAEIWEINQALKAGNQPAITKEEILE